MSQSVVLVSSSNLENIGISEVCRGLGWDIVATDVFGETEDAAIFQDLPEHTLVVLSVAPGTISNLYNAFVEAYYGSQRAILLTRGDVEAGAIAPIAHHFQSIVDSTADSDDLRGILKLAASGYTVMDRIEEPKVRMSQQSTGKGMAQGLSAREIEVTSLLSEGLSNKEIARKLEISENTVSSHLAAIRRKLSLRNRTEIALWLKSIGTDGFSLNEQR